MKIYLASGNVNKQREVQELLPSHKIVLPKDEGIDFDPEETGSSFFENAMIKAKALYDIVRAPVLADDSGLCVDFLNGAPGIHSARYGAVNGEHVSAEAGIIKVLAELKGVKERSARFACCMIFLLNENRFYSVQETCEGTITEKAAGAGGFGYDPIFFVEDFGKTFAELKPEEKNSVSHRGRALRAITKLIEGLYSL
ncbi:RdgB/HAM1 family non-canonical purine NTP pyrophosphatase [Treponema sp. OMZ 792]|uniref:RdgB/HAM1 family non-canonical purine NTP pyrophosphatase n=1 Tax=unclassified Treponema TaxID=2638727 RepID=UPI0020A3E9AD|nr:MULTISPECIES: RdgB/HAM1 family non-canonical purine NTP pyrophosphatase [unclassified Treponema]UTC74177.1 RdgB/HAM1 family non-canonical purine NTP pyrophosphatase [Treponema sp. OMZ 792]UTC77538.1 RdgB/HAM1 family non-canonical purine NTP pyrophosphatase [Treponema sp. OMZ 799]UTC80574.1 RdgB/HAM1 family non-canonical purine NTP pyrophosphatase [Treponema sp. OMZ 798]